MNANQFRVALRGHHVRDDRAPIAALRDIARVPEALHQHRVGTCDAVGAPASLGRLARKPVARHRRNHHVESVHCLPTMRRGIDQGIDDLQLLDDRTRPSVRNDDRQRIFMLRTGVNEVDVQPVDLGDEMRQGVHPRFDLAPVVFRRPVAGELLDRGELHALRKVGDGLLVGQAHGGNAAAKIIQLFVGRAVGEGADRAIFGLAHSGRRGVEDCVSVGGCHGLVLSVIRRGEHKWADRKRGYRTGKESRAESAKRTELWGTGVFDGHAVILVRREGGLSRLRIDSVGTQCAEVVIGIDHQQDGDLLVVGRHHGHLTRRS